MRTINQSQHLTLTEHLAGSVEEYSINGMGYYFTLNLTIAGYLYRPNIDTGSSDLFIKGEDSIGLPEQKYHCAECLDNNQKY